MKLFKKSKVSKLKRFFLNLWVFFVGATTQVPHENISLTNNKYPKHGKSTNK